MGINKIVAVSGTTGFVGGYVKTYLEEKGYEVLPLTRNEFSWSDQELSNYLSRVDFIINLAGESILKRWNKKNQDKIISSRVETTKKIARAIALLSKKPKKVINASAIGIYSYHGKHTEESPDFGNSFLTRTVVAWEKAAQEIAATGTPLCICRIGVVMGDGGGMLPKLIQMQKIGFGVKIGRGKQAISFIHIEELARSFVFLLEKEGAQGVYNMVASEYTTQERLLKVLHKIHKKSITIPVPAFVFKLLMGERANLMVKGEKVLPERLQKEGYDFLYPNIENALFYLYQW